MNMHGIDWALVSVYLIFFAGIIYSSRRLTKSVSDFLAASHCAGRYLITVAQDMAFISCVGFIGNFQNFYQSGFGGNWWQMMFITVGLVLTLSGWVVYRYRATRVMTLPELLERRYSRKFRIFTGFLAFFSGMMQSAIFPMVSANFMIWYIGIPSHLSVMGLLVPTYPLVVLVLVTLAVSFAVWGGQITIMLTDFFQGLVMNIGFTVLMITIFTVIGWDRIVEILKLAPEGKSLLNPFRGGDIPDFNWMYFMIIIFIRAYGHGAWQGGAGYMVAARTPHEARMAQILGSWRVTLIFLFLALLPMAAYTFLNHPDFAQASVSLREQIACISDHQLMTQVRVPLALSQFLPAGVLGLFLIMMFGAAVSTDDSYYHSWAGLFVQDVVIPLRGKPLDKNTHMKVLRWAIVGVGTFCLLFSCLVPLKDFILMWFQVAGSIYMGGAGAMLVGGLYWDRGTTAGAWSGMIAGCVLSLFFIVLSYVWTSSAWLISVSEKCPINGAQGGFIAAVIAAVLYVVVSLLTCRIPHNMDKLLHRGEYAIKGEYENIREVKSRLARWLGVTNEFTMPDKIIYYGFIGWTAFIGGVFAVGTVYNLLINKNVSDDVWAAWWKLYLYIGLFIAVLTMIWYGIGGLIDLKKLVRALKREDRDDSEDGFVQK